LPSTFYQQTDVIELAQPNSQIICYLSVKISSRYDLRAQVDKNACVRLNAYAFENTTRES